MQGGGVGFYIKDTIKFKRRKDIENKMPDLEHLWVELPGKNKNSRLLAGVIYRSEKLLPFNDWLEKFEDTIGYVKTTWDGPIMITGDMNIDLLEGQFTDFFFVHLSCNHKNITYKITKSQEKSHTESTKNHKSLKNY